MWEDVLEFVDNETGGDDSRLFVQEDAWEGSQYIRFVLNKSGPTALSFS